MPDKLKISFGKSADEGQDSMDSQPAPEAKDMTVGDEQELQQLTQLKQMVSTGDTQSALALIGQLIAEEQSEEQEHQSSAMPTSPQHDFHKKMEGILGKGE